MAYFAKLDDNNVVLEVHAVNNHELVISKNTVDENGNVTCSIVESEEKGIEFLVTWSGGYTNWKQTSYNATFRGKYAAVGDTFDPVTNMFIAPVVESVPVDTPVVESEVVVEAPQITQEPIGLASIDIPALTSSDVIALTSEQISGL
jgi:hypothetical protein